MRRLGRRDMHVLKSLCIRDWEITAENGDHFEVVRGQFYTTGEPYNGHVIVFSNFWVPVPVECFSLPEGIKPQENPTESEEPEATPAEQALSHHHPLEG